MARYDAAELTVAAELANVDVVQVAGAAEASAYYASAFMPIVNTFRAASRQGILTQRGAKSWGSADLDAAPVTSTELEGTVYAPTSRAFTCTGHYVDTILGQYALADARSGSHNLEMSIRDEIAIGYAKYFDASCAALFSEVPAGNTVGSATSALTGPLIDAGIAALIAADAPKPYSLVIASSLVPQLMQIPEMRANAIRGAAGAGGIGGPDLGQTSTRMLVRGYANVLDVYETDEIDVDTNAVQNLMVGNGAIANPWVPLETPAGQAANKLLIDLAWESQKRAIEINATTIETWLGSVFTSSTNTWMALIETDEA